MKYVPFLRWWLIFLLISVGSIAAYLSGFLYDTWIKDSSYLSYTTLGIFYFSTVMAGYHTWLSCKNKLSKKAEELGWFLSELCLGLGMTGTIVGFIMMLSQFETLKLNDVSSIQNLLSTLGKSMATALITTFWGLICGILLKIQYFNLSKHE